MSNALRLGLGNTVDPNTIVLFQNVNSLESLGKITDSILQWTKKQREFNQKSLADLRVLLQGFLEFGLASSRSNVVCIELAIEDSTVFVSLRFKNFIVHDEEDVEKKLSQHWLNSEDASLIKRILYPQDCVEVRFLKELNLIEWKVVRSLNLDLINFEIASFRVFSECGNEVEYEHQKYVEIIDEYTEKNTASKFRNDHAKYILDQSLLNLENTEQYSARKMNTLEEVLPAASSVPVSTDIVSEVLFLNKKIKSYEETILSKDKMIEFIELEKISLKKKLDELMSDPVNADSRNVLLYREKAVQMFEMVKSLQLEIKELKQLANQSKK